PGYHFVAWSGDTTGSTSPITITIAGDRSVGVGFALNSYPLTVVTVGGGAVTRTPDLALYPYGTAVTLRAAASSGWRFAGWGGTAPADTDQVVLDNSLVAATFTVKLPSGAATTTVRRLTITPAPGDSITLLLPSGNTANPGLRVGDAVAGTDDIVLDARALLR